MFKVTSDDVKTFKDIRIVSRKMKLFFDKEIKPIQRQFNREYKQILSLVKMVQWVKKKRKSSFLNKIDFWLHAINREGFIYAIKMLFGGEKYAFLDLANDYWSVKRDIKNLDLLENSVDIFTEEAEKIYFDKTLTEENKYAKFSEFLKQAKFLQEELRDFKKEIDELGDIAVYAKN